MIGAFLGLKPTALSNSGSVVSQEVAVRRVVDAHLACVCFSFFEASNASDVLKEMRQLLKSRMMDCKFASMRGPILKSLGIGGFELEKTCETTLLILPVMQCAESSSSPSLLAIGSSFLVQPMYLRVMALSESSGWQTFDTDI